jgi:hypothetical protein
LSKNAVGIARFLLLSFPRPRVAKALATRGRGNDKRMRFFLMLICCQQFLYFLILALKKIFDIILVLNSEVMILECYDPLSEIEFIFLKKNISRVMIFKIASLIKNHHVKKNISRNRCWDISD